MRITEPCATCGLRLEIPQDPMAAMTPGSSSPLSSTTRKAPSSASATAILKVNGSANSSIRRWIRRLRDLGIESTFEYGSRVGTWRVLDLFDEFDAKATIFACGRALERNPLVARAFTARGHEVAGHGYRWVDHFRMEPDHEREQIRLAVAAITETTGERPVRLVLPLRAQRQHAAPAARRGRVPLRLRFIRRRGALLGEGR